MSASNNLWSKLFHGAPQAEQSTAQPGLLQGLLAALEKASPADAPGACLKQVVSHLGANAGWMYVTAPKEPNILQLVEQAGPNANDDAARRLGHALAGRILLANEVPSPDQGMAALALSSQEKTIGAVVFWWDGEVPALPDALGAGLGMALAYAHLAEVAWREAAERRRMEERLQNACAEECQQEQELALLNSLVAVVVHGSSREAILEVLCRELVQLFGVTQSAAALLDESGETLHVVAEFVPPDRMPCIGMAIPVSNNPSSLYVIRMKEPLAVNDVQHDIRMIPIYELMNQRGVASMLILPLLTGQKVIGTIGVDSAVPREYSEAEIALALKAARLAAWAIQAHPVVPA
jgi:hypothetical protein